MNKTRGLPPAPQLLAEPTTPRHQGQTWHAAATAAPSVKQAYDPRVLLALTGLLGVLAWKATAAGVALYFLGVLALFATPALRGRTEKGALARTMRFALFWAAIKFLLDAGTALVPLFSPLPSAPEPYLNVLAAAPPLLAAPAFEAGVLFLRIATMMNAALALTSILSPRALALAATWFLRPIAGRQAWKGGLALALMAGYVPRIHHLCAETRQGALARRLPESGIAYWRLAAPHIFRGLGTSAWNSALGIAGRGIDRPGAWEYMEKFPYIHTLAGSGVAALLLAALWL